MDNINLNIGPCKVRNYEWAYCQCVTGVVWTGQIFEGLVQEEYLLVIFIIPVFAIAYIQD